MEITNIIGAETREELRWWFKENAKNKDFCWVIVSMKEQEGVIQYLDAVEEAICFGWIDSTKKKTSDNQLAQRLSLRKKTSNWTELNKERARRLIKLGLMKEEGLDSLPDMRLESFTIDKDIELLLKADDQLYENFINFPELYRRIRLDTIQTNKDQPELFNKRLN